MKKRILIILLMFVVLMGVSGCTFKKSSNNTSKTKKTVKTEKVEKKKEKKDNKEKKEEEKKNVTLYKDIVVGHYELIEMSDGETTYNKDELEELKTTGYVITIDFEKEKGKLKLGDDLNEFKYDEKYIYFNDEKIPYTYEDNKLVLKQEEDTLTFEKTK